MAIDDIEKIQNQILYMSSTFERKFRALLSNKYSNQT